MYDVYTGILRMTRRFRTDGTSHELVYGFGEDYGDYLGQYDLPAIAGDGGAFQKIKNLLFWLTARTVHKGDYSNEAGTSDSAGWLSYAFDDASHGINCAMLATILTECLLALRIPARAVWLLPFSPYDGDNHVVTEAYAADLARWVMCDPTYGLYVQDEQGTPLHLFEIRERLAKRQRLTFNPEANYNGTEFDARDTETYYAKDFAHFRVQQFQGRNAHLREDSPDLYLAPEGFDPYAGIFANLEYRAACYGEGEWLTRQREWLARQDAPRYLRVQDFYRIPPDVPPCAGL